MEYYTLLQLIREPFSNSPDPEFFFQSRQHHSCLQRLELALRLKRGLNVVIGDVGTGKTTLCRELIRRFASAPDIQTHLILDPSFPSGGDFLKLLHVLFCGEEPDVASSEMEIKEHLQQALFAKGVDQNQTVVLIVDEGQKLSSACVEILRGLLNFETNSFKLLQIAIFAQQEFEETLKTHANFADRINLLHHLAPMSFSDTRRMIYHRLKLSSKTPKPRDLFTLPALWAIFLASRGYPRKTIHLCHQSMLAMIIQNRSRAGWSLIRSCRKRMAAMQQRRGWLAAGIATALLTVALVAAWPRFIADDKDGTTFKIPATAHRQAIGTPATESTPSDRPAISVAQPGNEPASVYIPDEQNSSARRRPSLDPQISETALAQEPVPAAPAGETDTLHSVFAATMLGELPVKPGDTLLKLVHSVYGTSGNRAMRAVIEANSRIKNPNAIDLDDVVSFPALRFQIPEAPNGACRVVLDECETLPAAHARVHALQHRLALPMRMITYWTPRCGLRFQVATADYFAGEQDAQAWLDRQPFDATQQARIQTDWPEGALMFSDINRGHKE